MRPIILILGLILFSSCVNNSSNKKFIKEELKQLKVAAWNVEYSTNATAAEIGEALKSYNFDVVCFSEAPGRNWTQEVGDVMGLNYFTVGKYSTAGHDDKYKA